MTNRITVVANWASSISDDFCGCHNEPALWADKSYTLSLKEKGTIVVRVVLYPWCITLSITPPALNILKIPYFQNLGFYV